MNLFELRLSNQELFYKEEYLIKTMLQVEKELMEHQFEFDIESEDIREKLPEAVGQLEGFLGLLERRNVERLFHLLYRIDISEKMIADYGEKHSDLNWYRIVSEVIFLRCLQKILLREQFGSKK